MKSIKLYPPKGKGDPIIPHPSKVEEMKEKGWREKPSKTFKPKRSEDV